MTTAENSSASGSASAEHGEWLISPALRAVPGLVHGFTLRSAGDLGTDRCAQALLRKIGARRLRLLKQVHGSRVARPSDPAECPVADAWAGPLDAGVFLGILTADCVPVLLCHAGSGVLGLAHAGWRGATAHVIRQTLKTMAAPVDEVVSVLGPSIGPCCYQVGEEVAQALRHDSARVESWDGLPGKYRFDLPGLVRSQLEREGIPRESVHTISLCTACHPELFFSYRREGQTGRMLAFLGWREDSDRPSR